jgi:putative selenium metabolism protein SsnA
VTIVLSGGTVVTTLDPPSLSRADVVIDDGRIRAIGMSPPDRGERIDATGCIVIPGNVCAHHHLYSELARGMPFRLDPPRNFLQILQRVWWRLDRALDGEGVSLSAWAGGADAVLAGTTTVFDHHSSPNAIEGSLTHVGAALEELGVRSVLCYEVTDRDGPERATAGIDEHRRFGGKPHALARTMVGAHASFTLSDETLASCVKLADELDTGIHIHVAEDAVDEADAGKRFGRRVVERLAGAGALSGRSLMAHCVHVDEREATLIHEAGAWVAHNVRSNMANRVGRAPVAGLGTRLVIGTDGVDGDMFAESRVAYFRAREADASVGPEWALSRMAASARLAGAVFGEPLLGRIEQGAPADLLVLAYDPPTPITNENLAGHFVYGMRAAHVRDVLVGGEVVVQGGRLAKVSETDIRAKCREYAERLWRRLDAVEAHPFVPQGVP